jgi:hypothetical protein
MKIVVTFSNKQKESYPLSSLKVIRKTIKEIESLTGKGIIDYRIA